MLYTIVKKCSSYDDEEADSINVQEIINEDIAKLPKDEAKVKKRLLIKGKIQSVAKMNKMFAVLKEESELILKIKNISPDGKLPRGLLLDGKPAIKNVAKQFHHAAELDKCNEKRPKKK
jgi:serine/threonine-protein phosphatase 2B catalytic subunit